MSAHGELSPRSQAEDSRYAAEVVRLSAELATLGLQIQILRAITERDLDHFRPSARQGSQGATPERSFL